MENIEMVDLKGQYEAIQEEVDEAIQSVIDNTAFINGSATHQLAAELEYYLGSKYVVPCGSGTDALQIALMSLDLSPGDEIITTPFTFVATAEVIALLGLKPVFADVDEHTFNIDPNKVEEQISDRTKVILPAHIYGQPADLSPLLSLAEEKDLFIIEDNAQSIGAEYFFDDRPNQKTGTIGDVGCVSFFPSKNLGAFGDGGALCTDNEALAHEMQMIVNHGSGEEKYTYQRIGVNSRLDTLQAAVLRVKLRYLDQYTKARRKAADHYDQGLKGLDSITTPYRSTFGKHVFHQYTIKVPEQRDALHHYLKQEGIPNAIYYPSCIHKQPAYNYLDYQAGDFPVAEQLTSEVLSLPMHTELASEQQDFIINKVHDFFL